MIAVIDYGMGNLRSVINAFTALDCPAFIARQSAELADAHKIVLPGVGAFGDGMVNLRAADWVGALNHEVRQRGKLFLGICLGMQFLATVGYELGTHEGLGWVAGAVDRIPADDPAIRIPHIGWNDVTFTKTDGLHAGLGNSQAFYFVHSFVLNPEDQQVVSGVCSYGVDFAASLEVDNIYAVQFHPEKSQKAGLAVLKNFALMGGGVNA